MDDAKILGHINELAREEHELFDRESRAQASEADRQRRARRAAGLDPEKDQLRDEKTVEGYTA